MIVDNRELPVVHIPDEEEIAAILDVLDQTPLLGLPVSAGPGTTVCC
jgi:hypothetical protein